jgi:hypothetical protein
MIVEFRSLVRRAALAAPVAEARSWMWALYKPPQKSKRCAAGIFDRVRPNADGHGLFHFWESEKRISTGELVAIFAGAVAVQDRRRGGSSANEDSREDSRARIQELV